MSGSATRASALDHVVVVLFENRSLDNVLGRLSAPKMARPRRGHRQGPEQPDPGMGRARRRAQGGPYGIATDMDSPNPDSGEEYFHTNTQLFTRSMTTTGSRSARGSPSLERPAPGHDADHGRIRHRLHQHVHRRGGRQPTYDEYAQIMTGYTPEQLPVLSGIARSLGYSTTGSAKSLADVHEPVVLDRRDSSGLVVNSPAGKWFTRNARRRLRAAGPARQTWKVYVMEPMPRRSPGSSTSPAERPPRHALRPVHRVREGRRGGNPARLLADRAGHDLGAPTTTRRWAGMMRRQSHPAGPVVAMLGGGSWNGCTDLPVRRLTEGADVWNTALLMGWDEPGGTYDHVPPGPVPPPHPAAPAGEFGFTFDRSGYRVPAIVVSPWVEPGSVFNEEYRHTSLIATLGKPGLACRSPTRRRRPHLRVSSPARAHRPATWATRPGPPVPAWATDYETLGQALGYLGKDAETRPHRARPADGTQTPGATGRPLRRTHPAAHRRSHQGRRLPLLPPAGASRYRR